MAMAVADKIWILQLVVILLSFTLSMSKQELVRVPAIYNFGDSYSDTGNLEAGFPALRLPNITDAIPSQHCPYGRDFWRNDQHSGGRFSNGLLLIDFICDNLRIPLLSPYLRSVTFGSDFSKGANFAFSGATADPHNLVQNAFEMNVQVYEFLRFQGIAKAFSSKMLPRPSSFANSLYTIQIGGGDLLYGLFYANRTVQQVRDVMVPNVVELIKNNTLILLEGGGARKFLIFGQPAIGCLPLFLTNSLIHNETEKDSFGCAKSYNDLAQAFNSKLIAMIDSLRSSYPNATFIYADYFQANIDVLNELAAHNLSSTHALIACCGSSAGIGEEYNCDARYLPGISALFTCGCASGRDCSKNSEYISWDGYHYTQQFNKIIAYKFLKKSYKYLKPPVQLAAAALA